MSEMGDWLNVVEAADYTGLSVRTIRKACQDGRLIGCKKSGGWLIREEDLMRWHNSPRSHLPGPRSGTIAKPNKAEDRIQQNELVSKEAKTSTVSVSTQNRTARNKGLEILSPERRSEIMAAVPRRSTKPELALRAALHEKGLPFQVNDAALPGSPDIVLPEYHIAVFVNGCFWHRHTGCKRTTTPTKNRDFWTDKFARNVERDNQNQHLLEEMGWTVVVAWECEITDNVEAVAERICNLSETV